jgi:flagellar hook-associated protein 1 FlgK
MTALRANQAALSIVSSNVGNAQTPGYVARTVNQVAEQTGDFGSSVRVTGVNRSLDQFLQSQLRSETSGGAYADQMAGVLTQLQSVYGTPGAAGSLESSHRPAVAFDDIGKRIDADPAVRGSAGAGAAAQRDAQGIQTLRSNGQDLNISVGQANAAMNQIAQLNSQLQSMRTDDRRANLMDQRDSAIDQLSIDGHSCFQQRQQPGLYTANGVELVGLQASQRPSPARHTDGGIAVECRSDQVLGGYDLAGWRTVRRST